MIRFLLNSRANRGLALSILAFLLIISNSIEGIAQNMQFAGLYSPGLTYYSNPHHPDFNYVMATGAKNSVFKPNPGNPLLQIQQDQDAFLMCMNKSGKYQWHIWFEGSGYRYFRQSVVNSNGYLYTVLLTYSDSVIFHGRNKDTTYVMDFKPGDKYGYALLKIASNGAIAGFRNLGTGSSGDLVVDMINTPMQSELTLLYSTNSSHAIPGTSDTIYSKNGSWTGSLLKISTSDLHTTGHSAIPVQASTSAQTQNNVYWVTNINKSNGSIDPDTTTRIFYGADFKQVRYFPKDIQVQSVMYDADEGILYTILVAALGASGNVNVDGNNIFLGNGKYFLATWNMNQLSDTATLFNEVAGIANPRMAQTQTGKPYFWSEVSLLQSSSVNVQFLKGKAQSVAADNFMCWGPVSTSGFDWIRVISGDNGISEGTSSFAVDDRNQFILRKVTYDLDMDPGDYDWTYKTKDFPEHWVVAGYSCKPTAIFTYDQNGQKIILHNKSAGADSYDWDFGNGDAVSSEKDPVVYYKSTGDYTITLIANNTCGSDTFQFPINVNEILSSNHPEQLRIAMYPNPVKDLLTIQSDVKYSKIQVFGFDGKLLREMNFNPEGTYDVSDLSPGFFVVKVCGEADFSHIILKQ
ncbi:MAG: T9SS type A sorting domain-containing protein [Bacteroidetes bacterium]|nr:T9SS type A sorting domain-containing protein [Bacteroidota bacterium]